MNRTHVLLEIKEEAEAMIEYHRAQAELYLNQPLAVGQHPNVKTAVVFELEKMAKYLNHLDLLDTYFIK
jgi:hypothetical protein